METKETTEIVKSYKPDAIDTITILNIINKLKLCINTTTFTEKECKYLYDILLKFIDIPTNISQDIVIIRIEKIQNYKRKPVTDADWIAVRDIMKVLNLTIHNAHRLITCKDVRVVCTREQVTQLRTLLKLHNTGYDIFHVI